MKTIEHMSMIKSSITTAKQDRVPDTTGTLVDVSLKATATYQISDIDLAKRGHEFVEYLENDCKHSLLNRLYGPIADDLEYMLPRLMSMRGAGDDFELLDNLGKLIAAIRGK